MLELSMHYWSAKIIQEVQSARLSGLVSSYSAEPVAIFLVLKNILFRQSDNIFTIFSYSKSALSAINSFYSDDQ